MTAHKTDIPYVIVKGHGRCRQIQNREGLSGCCDPQHYCEVNKERPDQTVDGLDAQSTVNYGSNVSHALARAGLMRGPMSMPTINNQATKPRAALHSLTN